MEIQNQDDISNATFTWLLLYQYISSYCIMDLGLLKFKEITYIDRLRPPKHNLHRLAFSKLIIFVSS